MKHAGLPRMVLFLGLLVAGCSREGQPTEDKGMGGPSNSSNAAMLIRGGESVQLQPTASAVF